MIRRRSALAFIRAVQADRPSRSLAACLAFAVLASTMAMQARGSDRAAIRAFEYSQAAAWNRHDAAAYAALFTRDADVVNVQGWWWKGRAELERKLSRAFAFVFSDSRLTIKEVSVDVLAPPLAVVHVRWTMTGGRAPPGAPTAPSTGIQLQVLRKDVGHWRIRSFQNTNSVPEAPFPSKAPKARSRASMR